MNTLEAAKFKHAFTRRHSYVVIGIAVLKDKRHILQDAVNIAVMHVLKAATNGAEVHRLINHFHVIGNLQRENKRK